MGGVNTILQANNTTRVARAEYRRNVAETNNNNRLQSSQSSFADAMRSIKNKTVINNASKEYNFRMEQLSEELRTGTGAGFNAQMQEAAARGALAAQAGYVGVGGSSADLMDTAVRLQAEMDQEVQSNALSLMASRGQKQAAQIMSNAYNSMDMSRTFGQYDFRQYIEPQAMKRRLGKLIGVAVASYFGGPQAGEAVADFAVGTWQADNGDFQGSGRSFASAAGNGLSAAQQWSERGGESWGSAVFGNKSSTTKGGANVTQFGNNYDNFQYGGTSTEGLGWF